MRTEHFNRIMSRLDALSPAQLDELAKAVDDRRASVASYQAIDTARGEACCRHCGSLAVVRYGRAHGLQRYRCKDCHRTSSAITGTPLSGLRMKQRFSVNTACMGQRMTVRQTAAECGVAVSTAFRWRHRFLTAIVAQQPTAVEGLLEADETYFLLSMKGQRGLPRPARSRGGKAKKRGLSKEQVPVLVAIARGQGYTADRVMEPGMKGKELVEVLRSVVRPDTVVCSDGNSAYYSLQRELGVTLKMFSASKHGCPINPSFHVQTVNSYHSRRKEWFNGRCRGVATKYLPNYVAWQRLLEWFRKGVTPNEFIASALGRQLINT